MVSSTAVLVVFTNLTFRAGEFSETFQALKQIRRYSTATSSMESVSSDESGKFDLKAELRGDFSALTADSKVSITVGDINFSKSLSDDVRWKPGRRIVNLYEHNEIDLELKIYTHRLRIEWTKSKMWLTLNSNTFAIGTALVTRLDSEVNAGRVPISVTIGTATSTADFDFSCHATRKTVFVRDNEDVTVSVVSSGKLIRD